ncbi:hypothetical protein Tco_1223987, partial [Tanacetum coccineum]
DHPLKNMVDRGIFDSGCSGHMTGNKDQLEGILKRRNVVLSDSKEEEPEAQGRKSQDDPLVSLVQGL